MHNTCLSRRGVRARLARALFLGGCIFVTDVRAEWYLIARDEQVRLYVDNLSIRRQGDSARVLQITDFVVAQWADAQTAIGSIKALVEYDCQKPRSRAWALAAYSEQMAVGRTVASEDFPDPQWTQIEPHSGLEKLRQMACAK